MNIHNVGITCEQQLIRFLCSHFCRIANLTEKGDVIVTQDYGLAALVLGKGAKALNQNGLIYTDSNIENLLFTRFIGKKERMAGNRTKGPKKRTAQNDADFLKALLLCLG